MAFMRKRFGPWVERKSSRNRSSIAAGIARSVESVKARMLERRQWEEGREREIQEAGAG